jgi:hypothetical protein
VGPIIIFAPNVPLPLKKQIEQGGAKQRQNDMENKNASNT